MDIAQNIQMSIETFKTKLMAQTDASSDLRSALRTMEQEIYALLENSNYSPAALNLLAEYAPLSSVDNRKKINLYLKNAMTMAQAKGIVFAALYISLDEYETIHDNLGKAYSDYVLENVEKSIQHCLRTVDTVIHLGADQYFVIVEGVSNQDQISKVASRLCLRINQPAQLPDYELKTSASIGISLFPEDAQSEETLIRNSYQAMLHVKDNHRNTFHFHSKEA